MKIRSVLVKTFVVLAVIAVLIQATTKPRSPKDIAWGVTFSQKMSQSLGLDWRANYMAILNELHPHGIRLVAYWDTIEPKPKSYDFADLDWQMQEAEASHVPVILNIGQRVARWPECFYPSWLDRSNKQQRESELLTYLTTVVKRYKDSPNLLYWQVENEPFLDYGPFSSFGNCPHLDKPLLDKELALVKQLDTTHKTLMTDGGAWGLWYPAVKRSDVFGFTLYNKVYNQKLGSSRPLWPPKFYAAKGFIVRLLTGKLHQPYIVAEAGLEPWGNKQIYDMSTDEQLHWLSPQDFHDTLKFVQNTGYDTYYMWGVEWWYSLKVKGITAYWDDAGALIRSGKPQPPLALTAHPSKAFPAGFLWGASTSSHQVEGNTANQWSIWEKANASRLAKAATKKYAGLPVWPKIQQQVENPNNYISGQADDAYHRYPQDFAMAKDLGMNAQRISLEWSRIEPAQGKFNAAELYHYREEIETLRREGQEPFVTLWHWTEPNWFTAQGSWQNPNSPQEFATYGTEVSKVLGPDVTYWLTVNEPNVYTSNSYLTGNWPPQKRNPFAYHQVLNHLVDAHRLAYATIKAHDANAQVGVAEQNADFVTNPNAPIENVIKQVAEEEWNHYFYDRIASSQDFIGLNYYFSYQLGPKKPNVPKSDLGWPLNPQGIYSVLIDLNERYHKPIYITENGLADANDTYRKQYLTDTLTAVQRATAEGVPVKGYFHWSLLDNFEWAHGSWPKFGLIAVDPITLTRTPRPSAAYYSQIIKANALPNEK